jgi:hypothetical protein
MKRVIVLIVIIILVGLSFSLGFFSPYNCFTAKQELKNNHFKKICINDEGIRYMIEKEIGDKYGIEVVDISNQYRAKPINYLGIKIYNKVMIDGYVKYNGEKTYKKYKCELDSLQSQFILR